MSTNSNAQHVLGQSMSQFSISKGKCVICDIPTNLRCKECLKNGKLPKDIPFYCAKEHQLFHWKAGHKNSCGKKSGNSAGWKEIQTKGMNNDLPYYVATEDLKAGHALFTKEPLLTFPELALAGQQDFEVWCSKLPSIAPEIRASKERRIWTCVSCYEMLLYGELVNDPLNGWKMNKCTDCGWPLHSNVIPGQPPSDCQKLHAKECAIFTANGITWDAMKMDEGVYYSLGLLRAALLSPSLKQKLLNLPVFSPQNYCRLDYADTMISFVREKCQLADQVSKEELKNMILIIFTNVLYPSFSYDSIRKKMVFTIFQGGSTGRILSHDCNPNCDFYVNPSTLAATFKTTRSVVKGEILTINYAARVFPAPIYERVLSFSNCFMPPCTCRRCTDPTEEGTFASAIKCPSEKNSQVKKDCQYLVPFPKPEDKVTGNDDIYEWHCLCRGCRGVTRQKVVEKFCDEIKTRIIHASSKLDYMELKSIVLTISGKSVHPSSSLMLFVYLSIFAVSQKHIINLNIYKNPQFRFDLHSKYLLDFDKILDLFKVYQLGRNEKHGKFLFVHALLKMSELAQKISIPTTRPGLDDFEKSLGSIMANLKESWIIFKDSPYFHPMDITRDTILRNLYANHLGKMIQTKAKDFAALPIVKNFWEKYYVDDDRLEMEKRDEEKRLCLWEIMPADQAPQFISLLQAQANYETVKP